METTEQELTHHSEDAQNLVDAGHTIKVHNAGFVRLVRFMGGDASIVQAARVSYGNGTKSVREDLGLLRYLIRNQHWSPFEQVALVYHVKLPIFVARQFVRHRTAKLNEVSARYSELPAEFYEPETRPRKVGDSFDAIRLPGQDPKNKQAGGSSVAVPVSVHEKWLHVQREAFTAYKLMLEAGVARELARACLPVGTYTEWYWQMDLRNLLHFFALRCDSHAQKEARDYAEAMRDLARAVVPHTMATVDALTTEGVL